MNKYMKIAKQLADENLITDVGGPFGACVVKDGEIIGKGSNHVISDNDPTAHAEMVAIKDACKKIKSYDLTGCELYTSCYPCPMCLAAIIWANIKTVYYGNTRKDAEKIGFRDEYIYEYITRSPEFKEKKVLSLKPIDRDETIKTFKEFMGEDDKTIY